MQKRLVIAALVGSLFAADLGAYGTRAEAVENLANQTKFRKALKHWGELVGSMIAPITILAALSSKNHFESATQGFGVTTCIYLLVYVLRSGHVSIAKRAFRHLYNKRVAPYGDVLVSPFDVNASNLPFALDDQQFIAFGFASGHTAQELIHLANKCGRTEIARRIHDGEFFAHNS